MDDASLTVEEAARMIGCCEETVRRAVRNKVITGVIRFGHVYRVPKSECERLRREGFNASQVAHAHLGANDEQNLADGD